MNDQLISVIVPVYKVEPYLRRCLDSILAQTYKNLEIILVDDGSPDNCGAICDEYAAKDDRIVVIHKENGGVSSARNVGLRTASGEWIGWVDSDDWIELDMFEYLLRQAQNTQADISICGRIEEYKYYQRECGFEQDELLNTEEALHLLLLDRTVQNYLWDKLWNRRLFEGIEFPEGRTYEDIAIMHRLFEKSDRIVAGAEAKYHYFQREGSIIATGSFRNRYNYYLAAKARLKDMGERWPQFIPLMQSQCVTAMIGMWANYYNIPKSERREIQPQLLELSNYAKQYYKTALQVANLGFTGRMVLRLTPYPTWWAFCLAYVLNMIYLAKHNHAL